MLAVGGAASQDQRLGHDLLVMVRCRFLSGLVQRGAERKNLVADMGVLGRAGRILRAFGNFNAVVRQGAFERCVRQVVVDLQPLARTDQHVEEVEDFAFFTLGQPGRKSKLALDRFQVGMLGAALVGRDIAAFDRVRQVESNAGFGD